MSVFKTIQNMWMVRTLALYLSGTYCHKTGTRLPSCVTPRQLTIYTTMPTSEQTYHFILNLVLLFQFVQKTVQKYFGVSISLAIFNLVILWWDYPEHRFQWHKGREPNFWFALANCWLLILVPIKQSALLYICGQDIKWPFCLIYFCNFLSFL